MFFQTRKALAEGRPPPSSYIYTHMLKMAVSRNDKEFLKKFLDPDGYLEDHQNVIICSLCHYEHFQKISLKSVQNFSSYFANKQIKKRWQKHDLLGGGKNANQSKSVIKQNAHDIFHHNHWNLKLNYLPAIIPRCQKQHKSGVNT